jgi:uncharacterized membrane protein YhaH (DUF805 family)
MQGLLFSFDGRVNRAKFWLVVIATDIVLFVLFGILAAVTGVSMDMPADGSMPSFGGAGLVGGLIGLLLVVLAVWIGLAMGVKRYHDRNKSGWWVLIALVPVIGGLWYLIECGFLRGTAGPNQYGADPLAGAA